MDCPICKRNIRNEHVRAEVLPAKPVGVYYVHDYYGCDTGCCGHSIHVILANGNSTERDFNFCHSKETMDEAVGNLATHLGVPVLTEMCQFVDWC